MNKKMMKFFACPVCRFYPLELTVLEVVGVIGDVIVTGKISCPKCKQEYPIRDGIPELLVDLKGWYKGSGSPEAYDEHFGKWMPKTHRQQNNPWPFKVIIAGRARGFVLDAGCGPGTLNKYLKNTIFLDFSRVCLIDRWVGRPRPKVRANAECMPFRSSLFDTVVSTELIEHTDDPYRFVREVYRVLKGDGQFLFSFPWRDGSSSHHFKRITKDMIHQWVSPLFGSHYEYDVPPMRKARGMVYVYK